MFTDLTFIKIKVVIRRFSFYLIIVPSDIPNITVEVETATSVTISWLKPEKPNGEVSYQLMQEINGQKEVVEKSLVSFKHEFLNLEEFSNYTLFVIPCTKVGCGNRASVKVQTESASMYLTKY